jgi:hypothetical protein
LLLLRLEPLKLLRRLTEPPALRRLLLQPLGALAPPLGLGFAADSGSGRLYIPFGAFFAIAPFIEGLPFAPFIMKLGIFPFAFFDFAKVKLLAPFRGKSRIVRHLFPFSFPPDRRFA